MTEYASNKVLLFNCSLSFVDLRTDSRPVAGLDAYDRPTPEILLDKSPAVHILGGHIYRHVRASLCISEMGVPVNSKLDLFRDFLASPWFDYGISRKNQSASELWLSAYIANYIGNCLSFLNDFLQRVEIEPEAQGRNTKLLVKWLRVANTLGGLTVFQVLCVLAALFYCKGNLEIVYDFWTFSSMFTGFHFHSQGKRRQESAVHQGTFVKEKDGFLWVAFPQEQKRDSNFCSDRYANLDDLAIGRPIGQSGAIYSSVDRTTNFAQTVVSSTDSPILLNHSTEPPINACNK